MNRKSIFAAAGAWVLASAISIVSSVWPDKIKPHPAWVIGLFIVGLVLLICALIQKLLSPHSNLNEAPVSATIQNNNTFSPTNTVNVGLSERDVDEKLKAHQKEIDEKIKAQRGTTFLVNGK